MTVPRAKTQMPPAAREPALVLPRLCRTLSQIRYGRVHTLRQIASRRRHQGHSPPGISHPLVLKTNMKLIDPCAV